jgi:exodeoxyribonuclease V alpha subunit
MKMKKRKTQLDLFASKRDTPLRTSERQKDPAKVPDHLDVLLAAKVLSELDVHLARTLTRLARDPNPLVLLGAACISRFVSQGHVCADIKSIASTPISSTMDDESIWPERAPWCSALRESPLVGDEQNPWRPLVLDAEERLYLSRHWHYQQRLVSVLKEKSIQAGYDLAPKRIEKELSTLFPPDSISMTADQRAAVALATNKKLAIITGGPGTGKTFTVVMILAMLLRQAARQFLQDPRILLLAPTGKAASRLVESICAAKNSTWPTEIQSLLQRVPDTASTIHRALVTLKRQPNQFFYNAENPLPADIVIADEASMIDLALMTKLCEAVEPNAHLVLLGDKDQLASVEAGAILGDICAASHGLPGCVVELIHNHRFKEGSGIQLLAQAVKSGHVDKAIESLENRKLLDVEFIERPPTNDLQPIHPFLMEHHGSFPPSTGPICRLQHLSRFMILCAHKFDAKSINHEAASLLAQNKAGEDPWIDGEPIMITRNDYQLKLFNGDMGIISKVDSEWRAFFENRKPLSPARLPPYEPIYALTVHKAQGSEFNTVLLVLPTQPSPVLSRELVYTAITRAKKKVIVFAPQETLKQAIATPVTRASGLQKQLLQ